MVFRVMNKCIKKKDGQIEDYDCNNHTQESHISDVVIMFASSSYCLEGFRILETSPVFYAWQFKIFLLNNRVCSITPDSEMICVKYVLRLPPIRQGVKNII